MFDNRENKNGKMVSVCSLEGEILISRPPRVVWDMAIKETNRWWREDLKHGSLGVTIEDQVGGRIWERYDASGSGQLFGTVVAIEPPRMIHFTSTCGIAGVALCAYTLQFNRYADGTLVNAAIEVLSEYPERLMHSLVKRRIQKLLEDLQQYCMVSSSSHGAVNRLRAETAAVGY